MRRTNPFSDGLFFLTENYWATPIQAHVLEGVVLPNFTAFGYLIYSLEVIIVSR